MLPVSECRIDLCHPTEDPYQQTLWNRIEDAGAWLGKCANSNLNNGRREQPDGKELTKSDIQTSQNQDSVNIPSAINKNNAESDDSDNMKQNENERVGLSSSDRKAKDEAAHLHGNIIAEPHQKSEDAPSQACNSLNEEDDVMMILPIVETTSLLSRLSLNKGQYKNNLTSSIKVYSVLKFLCIVRKLHIYRITFIPNTSSSKNLSIYQFTPSIYLLSNGISTLYFVANIAGSFRFQQMLFLI